LLENKLGQYNTCLSDSNNTQQTSICRTFLFISYYRLDVVEGVEQEAAGSFSIRIHSPNVETFKPHYFSLNPINHTKNPWFREFWQQKFKCQLTVPKDDTVTPVCTGKENLTTNYEQDPKLSQVINSVKVIGLALKKMHSDKCKEYSNTTLCPDMESINVSNWKFDCQISL
jgi:hypothetical protein